MIRSAPAGRQRRRLVTAVTTLVGAVVLGWSLNAEPDSGTFYVSTFALAGIWAVGALLSGPLPLGPSRTDSTRHIGAGVVVGVLLAVAFVLGGLIVREIAVLEDAVNSVLAYARQGTGPLVVAVTAVNAVAEELFFRGALYAAVPARLAVPATTVVYTLASAASGNAMLAMAALLLGLLTALQRRATGGLLAPIATHVTWSLLILLALPPLFG